MYYLVFPITEAHFEQENDPPSVFFRGPCEPLAKQFIFHVLLPPNNVEETLQVKKSPSRPHHWKLQR
jgi:hypothetical protein